MNPIINLPKELVLYIDIYSYMSSWKRREGGNRASKEESREEGTTCARRVYKKDA
jgi:hypothetical protein